MIERKKRSYEQFQDKIFKNCMQSALGSVFVDFCVRISSKIADLFYAVCGGNDFCDDCKSDGEVSGEHGIGYAKSLYFVESKNETYINLLKGIKTRSSRRTSPWLK